MWSKITYEHAAWKMTDKTCSFLRGWNGRNLFRITGRSVEEESRDPTRNLVNHVKSLRLKWVGHILRKEE